MERLESTKLKFIGKENKVEQKESYTHEEVETMLNSYNTYKLVRDYYDKKPIEGAYENFSEYKEQINLAVENCEEKMPKSLMDILGIEKL